MISKTIKAFKWFGLNLTLMKDNAKGLAFYFSDLRKFKKQNKEHNFGPIKHYPILNERFDKAGSMSGHYFHQDLLVAQKIYENNPQKHVDIGSRTDGFVSHVATFRKIEIIDIRDQQSTINNILFKRINLMEEIPKKYINYTDSISSLHAIEHFGLGRYGDPVDERGHMKGLNNIKNMLKPGGIFYFSVPIGNQRIEFNAHRVFSIKYLLDTFKDNYKLISFSYVDDKGDLHKNIHLNDGNIVNSLGCHFGCGIFELQKI
jgi:hypothetical protein